MADASPRQMTPTMISPGRLSALMSALEQHGGTPDGGMHRLTLSPADGAARNHLAAWMRAQDLRVVVDGIGNMFGVLEWAGADAPLIMSGSHLDSQPHGGRFDGAYGVAAACEALTAVRARAMAEGLSPRCNLAVVNWTNEEGARFQPSLLGSSVYVGQMVLADALGRRDGDGVTVAEALAAIGYAGTAAPPAPAAYVELHVECQSELEKAGEHFGAVVRHWGAVKYRLAFIGRQAHTGPTPMAERRDALFGAAHLICALRAMANRAPGTLHTSAGRIEVRPNSPNVVPAEAVLFIELRSPDPAVLSWAEAALSEAVRAAEAVAGIGSEVRFIDRRPAGPFDAALVALAEHEAAALGHPTRRLDTIAGHDAIPMAAVCPSVLLMVPSVGGVCHHPDEFTHPDDVVLGADILARVLWRLCIDGVPGSPT